MFKENDFDDLDDLVDEGMDFVQEKDTENQGKINADDTKNWMLLWYGADFDKDEVRKAKEKGVVKVFYRRLNLWRRQRKKVQGDAHIERDAEVALRLQAELDEELRVERERQKEASKVAIADMFDEVQARIDVDYELVLE
ncbi:hypothetical protein Tco_1344600 [Tanacetum coccineum]